jgi:hypothetical protein
LRSPDRRNQQHETGPTPLKFVEPVWRGSEPTAGRLTSGEVVSGILGCSSDHNAVPYSLIEEFVAVYRIDPLMPNDYTSGQFGSWPSLRLWVSDVLHMRQRLDVYRDGEHCCIIWSHERVLRLPPQLAASPQDIVGRTATGASVTSPSLLLHLTRWRTVSIPCAPVAT